MNLRIRNIGIVKQADVELNGLTVIAGENDSGKSTVGKMMFSIVKAASRYEQDLNENKEHIIRRLIEEIYLFSRNASAERNSEGFRELFSPTNFFEDLKPFINSSQEILFGTNVQAIDEILESRIQFIELAKSNYLKTRILPKLDELKNAIFIQEDSPTRILRALKRVLFSEFYWGLDGLALASADHHADPISGLARCEPDHVGAAPFAVAPDQLSCQAELSRFGVRPRDAQAVANVSRAEVEL